MTLALPPITADLSLLLLRLILALTFIVASRNKARNIRKFAKNNGLPVPAAVMVAVAEMMAGAALLAGIFTQLAALVIMLLMAGTIRLHIFKWHSPYWAAQGGWEYDLMLFAMASVLAAFGGGLFVLLG